VPDYDAVVIGGGHHGTIIAAYLAKAGMKVGVFERQDRLGGGCVTEDGPAPGFRMAFCAEFSRFYAHPAFQDFDLYEEGLHYVAPETGASVVFDDGTSLVGYPAGVLVDPKTGATKYSEQNVESTYEQIAQFSKADAETYLDLTEKFKTKWARPLSRDRYSLPTPFGEPSIIEKLVADPESGLEPVFQYMTVKQLAHYFFESPELRILFLRGFLTSLGCAPDDVPGLEGLIGTLSVVLSWSPPSIALGGNQIITDVLVSAGRKLGAEYFTNSEVEKIIVENGVAKGISLNGGTRIEAKQLVVSDTGIPQLLFRLLGEEYVTPKMRRELEGITYDRTQILLGSMAVHELPQYKAAESNPDLNRMFRLLWGPKDLRYFEDKYWHEIRLLGYPSRPAILSSAHSIWDRSRTPEGKHLILFEEFTVPVRFLSYREWRHIRENFVEEHLLPEWQRYAPNMTKENIIRSRLNTPVEIVETHPDMIEGGFGVGAPISSQIGRFRGIPELAGFRTPVKNLYMCSSALHSGLGIAKGSSYCCYRVIAEDFGLPRFWEERGL
jgi:beta-carotene ketolase (CrtO type)